MRAMAPKTRIAGEFRVFRWWTASIAALPSAAAITAVLLMLNVNMITSLAVPP